MPRTVRTKVYKFQELTPAAQDKAISWGQQKCITTDYDWYKYIVDDFKENGDFFCITEVYFSGFSSQGDGAMFEYSSINPAFIKSIIDSLNVPNWKKNTLKKCIYVSGHAKQSGHYYHENSAYHSIAIECTEDNRPNIEALIDWWAEEIERQIIDQYKTLAKDLYRTLEKEYDYLTAEEAIKEHIIANEYEFTADGKRF